MDIKGLSQIGVNKNAKTGEVWLLKDNKIDFPDQQPGTNRDEKEYRMVLVLQNQSDLDAIRPFHLLVVPISSKDYKNRWDYPIQLSDNPNSGLKRDSFLRLNHIQPICKGDLLHRLGVLEQNTLQELTIKILHNMGLLDFIDQKQEGQAVAEKEEDGSITQ